MKKYTAAIIVLAVALVACAGQQPASAPAAPPVAKAEAAQAAPAPAANVAPPLTVRPLDAGLFPVPVDWLNYYRGMPADTVKLYYHISALVDLVRAQQREIVALSRRLAVLEALKEPADPNVPEVANK